MITETELDAANLHALNACNPARCPVCVHAKALPPPFEVPFIACPRLVRGVPCCRPIEHVGPCDYPRPDEDGAL